MKRYVLSALAIMTALSWTVASTDFVAAIFVNLNAPKSFIAVRCLALGVMSFAFIVMGGLFWVMALEFRRSNIVEVGIYAGMSILGCLVPPFAYFSYPWLWIEFQSVLMWVSVATLVVFGIVWAISSTYLGTRFYDL